MTICSHQADSPFMRGLISDLVISKFRKSMVKHDTNVLIETSGVIIQHKPSTQPLDIWQSMASNCKSE